MCARIYLVITDGFSHQLPDSDPQETSEWIDSFDQLVETHGRARARYILAKLLEKARENQVGFPDTVTSPYINTIPSDEEPWFPGDVEIERKIRAYLRWNAVAMVVRANHRSEGIGGHLATYASAASLLEVGFNHFFRGKDAGDIGDQVFFQGHSSPGIYARAFLEGRLSGDDLDKFRFETDSYERSETTGGRGLSSYPHPHLMPKFWEFPTVSMGLGPLNAIYQARFNRYLFNRELIDTSSSRVWCFVGDGEVDEPETLAAISLATREKLDNLTFVINCNLQRLDGPVRGNGKIIQELEAIFRGAGWNVIKVIWGQRWDELLGHDLDGVLVSKMNATTDGEYQKFATESGAFIREHFFGPDPRLRKLVEELSDEDLESLPRGGHDHKKLYAAYRLATANPQGPTVILAKTIKGWKLGSQVQARNATHQIKKMAKEQLRDLRDRLSLGEEISDQTIEDGEPPYIAPDRDSDVYRYLTQRRQALGGFLPSRIMRYDDPGTASKEAFSEFRHGSSEQSVSTTMVFARLLRNLIRDKTIGSKVVPIVPDEARTFGMDSLFREAMIYNSSGQKYTPVDADLLLAYLESDKGQILEEGISEAGAMASFTAAGTAYANLGFACFPFFTFYSMFGFQRVGDLIWAAADAGARGFVLGATAGRTTLAGEGLQHTDGHSHVLASVVPNLRTYDPAFAYELATIVEDGIANMYGPGSRDCFYYVTIYNENYIMPAIGHLTADISDDEIEAGILNGIYRFAPGQELSSTNNSPRGAQDKGSSINLSATVLFSGPLWQPAMEARELLWEHWSVSTECWSATSYKLLREEALECERYNRLHPTQQPRIPYIAQQVAKMSGPIVAVTDYLKAVPDQVARWIERPFLSLGTDGFGRSDTRENLRRHFEVDARSIVVSVLYLLSTQGDLSPSIVQEAIDKYQLDATSPDPRLS